MKLAAWSLRADVGFVLDMPLPLGTVGSHRHCGSCPGCGQCRVDSGRVAFSSNKWCIRRHHTHCGAKGLTADEAWRRSLGLLTEGAVLDDTKIACAVVVTSSHRGRFTT
jgi:hypothetical protein